MPEYIKYQRDLIQVITDFHSVDEEKVSDAIDAIDPSILHSLGDMDRPETIEWWEREKRKKWEYDKKIRVFNIAGDHELNITYDLDEIRSAEIVAQGGFHYLVNRIKKDHFKKSEKVKKAGLFGGKLTGKEDLLTAYTLLQDLLDYEKHSETYWGNELFIGQDLTVKEESEDDSLYQLRFIHGALDSCYSKEELEYLGNLWNRLLSFDDYILNFEKMIESGDDIMIRGHDHKPAYAYRDEGTGIIHIFEPFQFEMDTGIYIIERWKEGDQTIGKILKKDRVVFLERETKNIKHVSTLSEGEKILLLEDGKHIEFEQHPFPMEKGRKHVVTAGAICDGWTATIDCQETPVLQFHNIGRMDRIRRWRAGLGQKGTVYDIIE
ncbi:MAG: hypothetical protein JW882_22125 [Deltaproteobacteria bacterium]|nr:hypothetical protein [Deltaproteobacteria bacterium]